MGFFVLEVKKRAMSRQLNACFAKFNLATSFRLILNCRIIYKTNQAFSAEQVIAVVQATARIFV